jgi:hypothetical protein
MILVVTLLVCAARFNPVPEGGVTLHVSTTPDDLYRLPSIDRRIVWPLHQCFTTLLITVDLPHGGKTYGKTRESEPVYLLPAAAVVVQNKLINVESSVRMLRSHCANSVNFVIEVLNHTLSNADMFNFSGPATHPSTERSFADTKKDLPIESRFFVNTVMYVTTLATTTTKYILHADIDTLGLSIGRPVVGRTTPMSVDFARRAFSELTVRPNLLFVMPSRSCLSAMEAVPSDMSCRLFVSMTARFNRMLPLRYWASHVEDILAENMKLHNLTGLTLKGTFPCVANTFIVRKIDAMF